AAHRAARPRGPTDSDSRMLMMQRSSSSSRVLASAVALVLLPALGACYEYKPIMTEPPPVGETVALEVTDQGRVSLAERFGPGLAEIQGRVVSNQGNEYVVNVYRVSQVNGESAAWSGEVTRINQAFIGSVKGRQLSPLRTTLLAVVGAAGLYFIATRGLGG